MPLDDSFCHCHVHSRYSFRDGLAHVEDLVDKASLLGQPGIALTDHGVMYGMPDLFKATKRARIRAIPGMEVYEAEPHAFDIERDGEIFKVKWADLGDRHRYFHLTLWALDAQGWLNLVWLHSNSFTAAFHPSQRGKPLVDRASLETHSAGIAVGFGCLASRTNQALVRDGEDAMFEAGRWIAEVFQGRCWMELMGNLPEQQAMIRGQRRVAARLGVPCIATNDVHYLDRKDGAENGPHHMLVRSRAFKKADTEASGDRSDDGFASWYGSDGFYLKSASEMLQTGFTAPDLTQTIELLDMVDFDFDSLPKPSPPLAVVPPRGDLPEFDAWCARLYEDKPALRRLAGDLVA